MFVQCKKHPELEIADLGLKFKAGFIEVTNPKMLERLKSMPEHFGFDITKDDPRVKTQEETAEVGAGNNENQ